MRLPKKNKDVTRMSTRGQVVIPERIRKLITLKFGQLFSVKLAIVEGKQLIILEKLD